MTIKQTRLKDCFIIEPKVFEDARGYFLESFNQKTFNEAVGNKIKFIQDNESYSTKGVLRGMHYQIGKYAQAKLVRTVKGKVLDVVMDIREESQTFGQHISVELSEDNKHQLFIPRGFAHGFIVLSEWAIFSYKCDNFYNKASEGGFIYNDPELKIEWRLDQKDLIISEKDLVLPKFKNARL
ncbi:MAG: dTDP-4-dehydrorhamnose 3,5-epimerase [Psychroserpens sp.]|uniref:dTDP-4-dehydrorhamnose 3,5-epimerase n=1 Tax=Psychroserpens sp. TaxID=2020870 RepID=UPI003C712FCA